MEEKKMPPGEWRLREEIRSLQIALEEERVMREQSMANIGDLSRKLVEEQKRLGMAMKEIAALKDATEFVWTVSPSDGRDEQRIFLRKQDAYDCAAGAIDEDRGIIERNVDLFNTVEYVDGWNRSASEWNLARSKGKRCMWIVSHFAVNKPGHDYGVGWEKTR